MAIENYANSYQTALDGSIDGSQTTITVLSIVGAPAPSFRLRIEDEILHVTANAGMDYTVVRGTEGTSAASHANGAVVTAIWSAAGIDGVRASLFAADSMANLTNHTREGMMVFLTDSMGTVPRRNATGYDFYGPLFNFTQPYLSDFTQLNSPVIVEAGGSINLTSAAVSGGIFRGLYRTYSGNKTFGIAFKNFAKAQNYTFVGLFFYNSSSGRMMGMGRNHNSDGGTTLEVIRLNNPNSYNSSPVGVQTYSGLGELNWIHAEDDGTNLKLYWSLDGVNLIPFYTETRTAWVTPDSILIGVSCDTTTGGNLNAQMGLLSYSEI